jgi:V8-like Glu-specific endopeptidase
MSAADTDHDRRKTGPPRGRAKSRIIRPRRYVAVLFVTLFVVAGRGIGGSAQTTEDTSGKSSADVTSIEMQPSIRGNIKGAPNVPYWLDNNPSISPSLRARLQACSGPFEIINREIRDRRYNFVGFDVDAFDSGCLNKIDSRDSFLNRVRLVLGILRIIDRDSEQKGGVVCTATQITPRYVLSAMHCLQNPYPSDHPTLKATQLAFSRMDNPSQVNEVANVYTFNATYRDAFLANRIKDQSQDYTVLELAVPLPMAGEEVQVQRAIGDKIRYLVAGFNWLIAFRGNASPSDKEIKAVGERWTEFIRYGDIEACRVHRVEGSCLIHSCLTVGGTSGAPLIVASDSARPLEIAAVHSGDYRPESCPDRRAEPGDSIAIAYPNVAVAAEEKWIAQFFKK